MIAPEGTTAKYQQSGGKTTSFDMEVLVGYILLVGVLLSMALIAIGVAWHWLTTGQLGLEFQISGMNLFEFVLADFQQILSGAFRPRLFVNLGITALMLTPYIRVLASLLYFAFVERNRKYTVFTGFVFAVLTYSLFLW
jgi:uncharacterized membrane protein